MRSHYCRAAAWTLLLTVLSLGSLPSFSYAASAKEIDASVDAALDRFHAQVKGAQEFTQAAKGILVIPNVLQAGFGIGGEYGEGALRIGDKTVDYYRLTSASFGFQLGAQRKDILLVFMQDQALQKFRESAGWEAGVDGSVALVNLGAEKSIDTTKFKEPIVGFVVGQQGLMYNLSLAGTKFTKLEK